MHRNEYTRRGFLKAVGASAAALAFSGCGGWSSSSGRAGKRSRPNIILIITDDQGYGDVSCYGAKDLRTPNMDALINGGMRLDNFYANCPVCAPTRASIMTGMYPDLVGVPGVIRTDPHDSFGYLDPRATLLPKFLKAAGYHTAIVGKWHLGLESPNKPNERGFDHFHGFLGDMMDDYYTHLRLGHNYMRLNEKVIDPKGHATDLFTQWSVDYIKDRAGKKEPFFLYLAYNAPHIPVQPPEEWLEKVKGREPGIDDRRAKLVAFIEHLDDGIGKVMDALKETGADKNTLVFFTSDNGGQLSAGANNGDLNGTKGQMLEGGIKVPFGARWPGRIKAGSSNDTVALSMDLFPTICDAAGARYEREGINGRSVLDALLGGEQPEEDRVLFWVRREGYDRQTLGRAFYAVRNGDWKLLQNSPEEPLRLYNLKDDPHEDRALEPTRKMHKALKDALQDHIIRSGAVPWQKYPVVLPERR